MSTILITQTDGPQRVVTSMKEAADQIFAQLEDEFFTIDSDAYDKAVAEAEALEFIASYVGGMVGPLPDGTMWKVQARSWDDLVGFAMWDAHDTDETIAERFNDSQAHV